MLPPTGIPSAWNSCTQHSYPRKIVCGCRLISRGIHQEPFKSAMHQTKLISRRYIEFGIVPPMQPARRPGNAVPRPDQMTALGPASSLSLNFCYLIAGHVITFLYTRHISDFPLAPSTFFLSVRCCYFLCAPQSDSRGSDWHSQYKFVSDGEKMKNLALFISLVLCDAGQKERGSYRLTEKKKSFLARDWGRK